MHIFEMSMLFYHRCIGKSSSNILVCHMHVQIVKINVLQRVSVIVDTAVKHPAAATLSHSGFFAICLCLSSGISRTATSAAISMKLLHLLKKIGKNTILYHFIRF